jgi:hypothetical protein
MGAGFPWKQSSHLPKRMEYSLGAGEKQRPYPQGIPRKIIKNKFNRAYFGTVLFYAFKF